MQARSSAINRPDSVALHYQVLEDFYAGLFENLSIHYPLWLPETCDHEQGCLNSSRLMAESCRVRGGQAVLDSGCGLGGPALWLAEQFGAKVVGLSICKSNIIRCNRLAERRRLEHLVSFVVGDFIHCPFPTGVFDVVWNLESFNYASPKQTGIIEASRVLKPGGSWVCLDGFIDSSRCSRGRNRTSLARIETGFGHTSGDWERVPQLLNYMQKAGFGDVSYTDLTRYVIAAPRGRYLRSLMMSILDLRCLRARLAVYLMRVKLLLAVYHTWRLMNKGAMTYGLLFGRKLE